MVIDSNENFTALALDRSTAEFDKEEANLLTEERMIDIASTLGISVEDRLGELRSFFCEMVKKGKGRGTDATNSKKKSRAKRELDKLVFSVNNDRPVGNKELGVQLLGL